MSAYGDGALALYEVVAVKEHLAGCAACRADLAALKRLNRRLAEAAHDEPAIDWTLFEARLGRHLEAARSAIWAAPWYRQVGLVRAGIAAAAVVLVMVGAAVAVHAWLRPAAVEPFRTAAVPSLVSAEPDLTSTLRYQGDPRPQVVAQIVPRSEPEAARGAPEPERVEDSSLRLAWLAGHDVPVRPGGASGAVAFGAPMASPRP